VLDQVRGALLHAPRPARGAEPTSLATEHQELVVAAISAAQAQEAKTIQHTKKIVDVAAAAEIYVRRQNLGVEAEKLAASVKVDALRKLGEMLKAAPKAKGVRGQLKGRNSSGGTDLLPPENQAETLAELRIDKRTSAVAQKLAELPEAAFEQVREGNETMAKALAKAKAVKEVKDAKPVATQLAPTKTPLFVVQPPPEDEYTDLDAAQDQVEDLQNALVVANMGNVAEEDKAQAATLIQDLRGRIRMLEAMLNAVKTSRDTFQAENAQMRLQINRQRREIDRATGRRTA